jgi:hypothetical protein
VVQARLDWAAARWRGGHTDFDLLAVGESGVLAYTIWIEKGDARMQGIDEFRRSRCESLICTVGKAAAGRSSTATPTR